MSKMEEKIQSSVEEWNFRTFQDVIVTLFQAWVDSINLILILIYLRLYTKYIYNYTK